MYNIQWDDGDKWHTVITDDIETVNTLLYLLREQPALFYNIKAGQVSNGVISEIDYPLVKEIRKLKEDINNGSRR